MIEWIVTSSVLIAVVTALRFLFRRKISRRLQYALWGMVLLRLLMPFSLSGSPLSIMNVVDTTGLPKAAAEIQGHSNIAGNTGKLADMAGAADNDIVNDHPEGSVFNSNNLQSSTVMTNSSNSVPVRLLGTVWLVGSIAAGLWFAGTNLVFYRRLVKTRDAYSTGEGNLPVYIVKDLGSPCLFGIIRPAIYMTPKAAADEDGVRYVLAHEHCHYRHGDHIWPILRGLCLAVWWWNPLVWIAAILSRTDSELACDDAVIRQIGDAHRLGYGRTLINMIAVKKDPAGILCAATAMSCGKRGIKARLNMIIRKPKTFLPAVITVLLIAAVSAGCTFTGALSGAASGTDKAVDNSGVTAYAQELYDSRHPYIGAAPADNALLAVMGVAEKLGSYKMELETRQEPYVLRVVFTEAITDAAALNSAMNDNAMLLLALIDNASEIQWKYIYIDQSAGGSGEFTGSLTKADATAALSGKDVKSYGQSAAEVQALLDWMDTARHTDTEYTLMQLGKSGVVLKTTGPLSGDDAQLAQAVIMSYMVKSAAWPGVDIRTLYECYLLQEEAPDGTSTTYYAYLLDGSAVMQNGSDGHYSRIDDGLYEKLAALAQKGTSTLDRTNLEACVSMEILDANAEYAAGDVSVEAHTTLLVMTENASPEATTVYAMAMFLSFNYTDGGILEAGGNHMPVALTFEKNDAGEYTLTDYWVPQDGSYYNPSIKEKFPAVIYEDALDTQKYVTAHTQACYSKAITNGNVPVDDHLGKLIETICSSPSVSSNSQDYIDAHPVEYREMIYYGTYTLNYCFALFDKGGQTGLQGHIMASACRDIIGEPARVDVPVANGQEWYDAYKKPAGQ